MCVKLPKPLNPEAEEWRPPCAPPPLPLLPRALIHPAPPPLVVSLTAAPHPQSRCDFYTHCTLSFHTPTPPIFEGYFKDFEVDQYNKKMKRPQPKRFLPPRLRSRALRSKNEAPPPPPKLEWRPKTAPPPPATATSKVPGNGGAKTTLMIRNIPNQLRRDFMLKFLDGYSKIHSLEYDFFYLPIDFRRLGNLGYAFVNFTTAAAAVKMKKILRSYKWRATYTDDGEFVSSNKVGEITWARIQGKEALVRRFAKSNFNCDDEEFLPVVLDPPRNGSDSNPPRPISLGRLCGPADIYL